MGEKRDELELIELGEVSVETKGTADTSIFENNPGVGCVPKKPSGSSTC